MKQLLILSGKGGTGKTTVAAALTQLSAARAVADCDVDAPNLHLVLPNLPEPELRDFFSFQRAVIDREICIDCGLCERHCVFEAIENNVVSHFECEGCAVCAEICPVAAIEMTDYKSGDLELYKDGGFVFSSATLKMGSGASGKLVSAVKAQLAENADGETKAIAIIDGSPGIGCPVIASITGVSFVLVVAEPSVSGIHDMRRILKTVKGFGVGCAVCVNRHVEGNKKSEDIEQFCRENDILFLGKIPYDDTVIHALNRCETMAEHPQSPAGRAIASIWERIVEIFESID